MAQVRANINLKSILEQIVGLGIIKASNTFLVLNFSFNIVDGVAALDLESNGLPR